MLLKRTVPDGFLYIARNDTVWEMFRKLNMPMTDRIEDYCTLSMHLVQLLTVNDTIRFCFSSVS